MLQENKMKLNMAMALYLLTLEQWDPKEVAGVVGRLVFAAAFTRPLLAVMDELFQFVKEAKTPTAHQLDELVCTLVLLPWPSPM